MKRTSRNVSRTRGAALLLAITAPLALYAGPSGAAERVADGGGTTAQASTRPADSQVAVDPHAHSHAHGEHQGSGESAVPAGGWASDAPLRQGMQAILDAVVAAVRNQGEGPELAAELRAQISFLFANCRLEPEADAALHGLLAELLQSAQRLEGGASAGEEHDALHAALQRYGQQFQHPGWPLR